MELFTVNRYDTAEKQQDPDREKRILENLQKNIDKKKSKLKNDEKRKSKSTVQPEPVPVEEVAKPAESVEVVPETGLDSTENVPPSAPLDAVSKFSNLPEAGSNFMVLGKEKFQRSKRIDMVLPPWLASPTIITNDLSLESSRQGVDQLPYLSDTIKASLKAMQINELFPVQQEVVPWVLDVHNKPYPFRPRDICVSAPTGSGKTLAYALPIVQLLQERTQRKIRALIVLPVNELAVQVLKIVRKLCEGTTLTCALLTKFVPFETEQAQLVEQYEGKWYSKVDIVVATTGRLVEHLHSTPGFSLKSLKFLVMDEADRIMEQVHNNWLYHLDAHVKEQSDSVLSGRAISLCYSELESKQNRQPHKLLFSATLSQDPEKLKNLHLFQPKLFTAIVNPINTITDVDQVEQRGEFIGKYTTPAELTEKFCLVQAELKPLSLYTLIKDNQWKRFLCFTNSGESAHRLSFLLQQLLGRDMRIEELSSGLSPSVRNTVLTKFQMGHIDGLISSDALARGIDVQGVEVVISYEMPRHIKTYIHRVGRTARAGKQGLAVTLLLEHEKKFFEKLIKEGGKSTIEELKVTSDSAERKAKDYTSAVEKLQNAMKREQQQKVLKQVNEKNKPSKSKGGLFDQLQSQLQETPQSVHHQADNNLPQSWQWQNQQNIVERKERKGKAQQKRKREKNNAAKDASKKAKTDA